MLFLGFTGEDRDCQSNGKFYVVSGNVSWDNVSLFTLNHAFDSLEGLGRV